MKDGVVLIAQAIIDRQCRSDLPLVLCEEDVIRLPQIAKTSGTIVKWTGGAYIAEVLNRRRLVAQKGRNIREGVCSAALPIGIHTHGTDFTAELHGVTTVNNGEIIDE